MTRVDAKKKEVKGKVELCPSMKTSVFTKSVTSWSGLKQIKQFAAKMRYQLPISTHYWQPNSSDTVYKSDVLGQSDGPRHQPVFCRPTEIFIILESEKNYCTCMSSQCQSKLTYIPVQKKIKQTWWKKIKAVGKLSISSYFVFACFRRPFNSTTVLYFLEKASSFRADEVTSIQLLSEILSIF